MRAGTLKLALIGFGVLVLQVPLPADPSDDLGGSPGSAGAGGDKDSDFNNIEIVDPALESKLDVVRIGSRRGANNLLGVFAGLKNKTAHKLELEIETIYRDSAGNDLNTGSWIHLTLDARAQQDYRSAAISEAAVDFLIRVRVAHASSH
jgi:hypothetical protein